MGVPPIRQSGVISAYARHATTMALTMSSGKFTPTNTRTRAQATAAPTNRVRAGAGGNGSDAALGLIRFVDPRMRSLNYSISPIASCVPTKAPMVSIDCRNPKHAPRIAGGATPD
ncbi:hypothetical protein OKW41_000209 [Paraburkholderia sp. UCT70]|uniref:hypothetical protein n=1 Tax=Paraburkholderia sp. UCT70 TaxID=2991068 RepID=UPI003D1EDE3A